MAVGQEPLPDNEAVKSGNSQEWLNLWMKN